MIIRTAVREPLPYHAVFLESTVSLNAHNSECIKMFHSLCDELPAGLRLNIKTVFPGMGVSIINIRRSWDRLIFIMGIPILVRLHLYIETVSRFLDWGTKTRKGFWGKSIVKLAGCVDLVRVGRNQDHSLRAMCTDAPVISSIVIPLC